MYGLSYLVPRVCWMTFLILMLVWICKTQNGFAYTNTKMGSQGYLNRKAHGSKMIIKCMYTCRYRTLTALVFC